jgi:hypothetical protein
VGNPASAIICADIMARQKGGKGSSKLRRFNGRALRKRPFWRGPLAFAAGASLLAGCAGQGILPQSALPPDPAGPAPAFPSFIAPDAGDPDVRRVLTNVEQQELEEELTKLAKDRETSVKRRIERTK